jgi:hypothetical protein
MPEGMPRPFSKGQWASFLVTMAQPNPSECAPPTEEGGLSAFLAIADLYQVGLTDVAHAYGAL